MSELVRLDDLEILMQKVRAEVESRKVRADTQAFVATGASAVPPPVDVNRMRYTAVELLTSYDAVFMRSVYLAILGYEPRGEEAARLLQQLRLGQISRIDLIDTLMSTHDAHARGAVIIGLGRKRFIERTRRSLIARKLAALMRIAFNIPRLASYMRQVISRVDHAERKVQQLEHHITQASQERQAFEASMQQQVQKLISRIDALEEELEARGLDENPLSVCARKASSPMRAGL